MMSGRGACSLEVSNLDVLNLGPEPFPAARGCCVTPTLSASTSRGGGIFRRR